MGRKLQGVGFGCELTTHHSPLITAVLAYCMPKGGRWEVVGGSRLVIGTFVDQLDGIRPAPLRVDNHHALLRDDALLIGWPGQHNDLQLPWSREDVSSQMKHAPMTDIITEEQLKRQNPAVEPMELIWSGR